MSPLKMLQTSPNRANELFARITATTPGAIKTRERLFTALKREIQLLTKLEHDHLLPVLKKHAGTKTILARTAERIERINQLLRRLESASKAGDDFLAGVAELKSEFQQHLRDGRDLLLPKVQKAFSDAELEAVAGRIEIDGAEVQASVRHKAEVQRANARRKREAAHQAATDAAERQAREVERKERIAVEAADRAVCEPVEQATRLAAFPLATAMAAAGAGMRQTVETLRSTRPATSGMATLAHTGMGAVQAAQETGREWISWAQLRALNQTAGLTALLMECRTPLDVLSLHERLVREDLELFARTGTRIAQLTAAMSGGAAGALAANG